MATIATPAPASRQPSSARATPICPSASISNRSCQTPSPASKRPARFPTSATSGTSPSRINPLAASRPAGRPGRREQPGLHPDGDQQAEIGIDQPDAQGRRGRRRAAARGRRCATARAGAAAAAAGRRRSRSRRAPPRPPRSLPPGAEGLDARVEREIGARHQADQRSRQDDEESAEERQRPGEASRRSRGPPRSGCARPRRAPTPAASATGTSSARASMAIVQPGSRFPASRCIRFGPCSTAPGEASRARISESAARPKRAKVSVSKDPGVSRPGSTGSSPSADSRTAGGRARSVGPGHPVRPGARAGRDRRAGPRRRPASPARSRRSSRRSPPAGSRCSAARSTRGSPAERSDSRGPAGSARWRHRARRASAVVADEALRAQGADARAVGGDEDERLVVGGPREAVRDLQQRGCRGSARRRAASTSDVAGRDQRDLAVRIAQPMAQAAAQSGPGWGVTKLSSPGPLDHDHRVRRRGGDGRAGGGAYLAVPGSTASSAM